MVTKACCHIPVVVESESVAIISPLAPLVIKLLAQKKATENVALVLGKISSCSIFLVTLSSHVTDLLSWDA